MVGWMAERENRRTACFNSIMIYGQSLVFFRFVRGGKKKSVKVWLKVRSSVSLINFIPTFMCRCHGYDLNSSVCRSQYKIVVRTKYTNKNKKY